MANPVVWTRIVQVGFAIVVRVRHPLHIVQMVSPMRGKPTSIAVVANVPRVTTIKIAR